MTKIRRMVTTKMAKMLRIRRTKRMTSENIFVMSGCHSEYHQFGSAGVSREQRGILLLRSPAFPLPALCTFGWPRMPGFAMWYRLVECSLSGNMVNDGLLTWL